MLTGSLYVADSLESGIAISGHANSGFIRSLGYDGFTAANPGFLLWSGSALNGFTTAGGSPYAGIGLEMYANADNYFRYSTSDNQLDIHTETFFLGSPTSFISGDGSGNIEIGGGAVAIKTEEFFLGNSNNFISGSNGNIKISGSAVTVRTSNFVFGDDDSYISGSSGGMIQISGSAIEIQTKNFHLGDNDNCYIRGYSGFIDMSGSGVTVQTPNFLLGNNTNFISGSGGNIKISGSNVSVATPSFFLGNNNNFVSGSNGNIQISGSNVDIETPNFFLGDNNTFISGSNGNLQISSSNFRISQQGGVTASSALLRDSTQSDMFVYRLRDAYTSSFIASGQTTAGTSTYIAATRPYVSINLTGSRGVNAPVDGPGPGALVRVVPQSLTEPFVVGRICIHPDDFYLSNKYQQFGSSIMLEAGYDFYLAVTEYPGYSVYAGDYDDSAVACDSDDWIYPALQSYTINNDFTGNVSITYPSVIKVSQGTQVLIVQSKFAWRVVAMSSYEGNLIGFNGGIQSTSLKLTSLPTTNPGGSGIVWNDGGTLKIT